MGGAALTRSARAAALALDAAAIASACAAAAAAAASRGCRVRRVPGKSISGTAARARFSAARNRTRGGAKRNLGEVAQEPLGHAPHLLAQLCGGVPGSGSTCFESPREISNLVPLIPSISTEVLQNVGVELRHPVPAERAMPRARAPPAACARSVRDPRAPRDRTRRLGTPGVSRRSTRTDARARKPRCPAPPDQPEPNATRDPPPRACVPAGLGWVLRP